MRRMNVLVAVAASLVCSQTAAQYRAAPVSNSGIIAGTVRAEGEIPSLPPLVVFKHQEVCGPSVVDERLRVEGNGELRNAIVYLAGVATGKPIPEQSAALDNSKCAFVPHVLTATIGQTLEIHNSDPFLHDAHAWLGPNTLFNVAVPKGRTVRRKLLQPGLVHINCNVRHTWMHAYLYVGENPYHVVTGEGGKFEIDEVPPGTYTLHVWHEVLGSAERQVIVQSGKTTSVDLGLRAVASDTP